VVQAGFVGRWTGEAWESMVPASELPTENVDRVGCAPAVHGGLWVLLGHELRRFSRGTEVARLRVEEPVRAIWSMTEDTQGNLWICSSHEGVRQRCPDGTVRTWSEGSGLASDGVRFAFEDKEGNIWIGTSGDGLTRLKARRFRVIDQQDGLSEQVVKSVWPGPDGETWIGTYGGGLYSHGESGLARVPLSVPFPAARYVQSVMTDRHGRTWVGTFGNGLHILQDSRARQIPTDHSGGDNVIALFEDSRGRIWISGGQSIRMHHAESFHPVDIGIATAEREVRCFGEDTSGAIWISNYRGVYRQTGQGWEEVVYPDGKPVVETACFHRDLHGSMWLGTLNNGLLLWDQRHLTRIDRERGLPVRGVHAILTDERGVFWMATDRGILRTTREELCGLADGARKPFSGQLLDRNDGLPSIQGPSGQQPIAARDRHGRVWFATVKGAAFVDTVRFQPNPVPAPAIITALVWRKPGIDPATGVATIVRLDPPFAGRVRLPPGSRRVEIHFTAPSFSSPEKVRFQTRLDGLDKSWRENDTRRVAYFDEMPAGTYVFRVRAANDDGLWETDGTTMTFTILPSLWQTTWFRGAAVATILGCAGLGLTRMRSRFLAREASQAEFTRCLILSQEKERGRIARELHDDVSQRLARLAIDVGQLEQSQPASQSRSDLAEIQRGLALLSKDVHSLAYQMHPSILEDLGLAEALKLECERFAAQTETTVRLSTTGIPQNVPLEQAVCLFRVTQESLRNVRRHASAHQVEITLRGLDRGLQLAVLDDGRGFDPARVGRERSLGLIAMRERVQMLGGTFHLETGVGQGTALFAWLPMP
jgi:signal transduction histidine kinase/streptogramin lyase